MLFVSRAIYKCRDGCGKKTFLSLPDVQAILVAEQGTS